MGRADPAAGGEMTWTTEKPTQPGWYWYKKGRHRPFIVEIFKGEIFGYHGTDGKELIVDQNEFVRDLDSRVRKMNGQWAGPIFPPE